MHAMKICNEGLLGQFLSLLEGGLVFDVPIRNNER